MRTCIAASVGIFLTLIIFCVPLAAQTKLGASEWRKPNPTIPEDAAILRWYNSIQSNDFPAFVRLSPKNKHTTPTLLKAMFESIRSTAPTAVMISKKPGHTNPNGSKDYYLVGCVKKPSDLKEMRVMATVTPIKVGSDWTVMGVGFSPPWNNTVRDCPVR